MTQLEAGLVIDDVLLEVEAGKVREFARATGALDAAHSSDSAAAARGLSARPATLTHTTALAHLRDQSVFVQKLGMDIGRIVVGEVGWRYLSPLMVGDRLRATRRVASDEQREGGSGRMRLVTLETEFVDTEGSLVATVREVLIERGDQQ